MADRVPTGQMKAQRQLLREQIARVVELAKTLGVEPDEVHQLLRRRESRLRILFIEFWKRKRLG